MKTSIRTAMKWFRMAIKWTIRLIASIIVIYSAATSCVSEAMWRRQSAIVNRVLNGGFKPGDILDENIARRDFSESEYVCGKEVYGSRMYGFGGSSLSLYYTRSIKEYERKIVHSICVVSIDRMDPGEYWLFYDICKMCRHIQLSHEAVRRKR